MIFTLARAEEIGIGAEIWRQPQRLTRLQPPISAVSFVGANATLSARLEECLSIVRANGREHVHSTLLHHAVHQLLPTKHLLQPRGR